MRAMVIEIVLLIIALIYYTNGQLVSSDLHSYPANMQTNITTESPFMTSTLCLYYPNTADVGMDDANWKETVAQLFVTKGWPSTSVYFNDYNTLDQFSINPQFYCDYNIVIVEYTTNNLMDINEIVNLILYNWECNPMDINLYYYAQTSNDNKWIASGNNCTVSVCPLNTQTLGIGCSTTDNATFEQIALSEKLVIMDVVDDVNYKIALNQQTCTIKNCNKKDERLNVAVLQVGGPDFIDLSEDPVTVSKDPRVLRIQWKKWWQVFYTIVDYINNLVNVMFARSRSLDVAQFYYRR